MQPEIKCRSFYKHSKVYRLLWFCLVLKRCYEKFKLHDSVKKDCQGNKNKFESFWSASTRPLRSFLRLKSSFPAHCSIELECWRKTKTMLLILKVLLIIIYTEKLECLWVKFPNTMLFKRLEELLDCSTTQLNSKTLLLEGIHGFDLEQWFFPLQY